MRSRRRPLKDIAEALTRPRAPAGVRNLRHLATAITQQKVSYEFPYSSFELDTDLNFVLLSEGKAILPVSLDASSVKVQILTPGRCNLADRLCGVRATGSERR